jgi:curved DNA-binding protein CbpA
VSGAWEILSDSDKRAQYDQFLAKVIFILTGRNWENRRVWKGRKGDSRALEILERGIGSIRKIRNSIMRG